MSVSMIGGKNSTNRNEVLVLSSNTKMLRCCTSRNSSKRTNKIALKRKRNAESQLLLLGMIDSGKSTIVKQIKIIFDDHVYTTEEYLRFKPVIFSNIIEAMLAILEAMNRSKISFDDPLRQNDAEVFLAYTKLESSHEILPANIGQAMQLLWKDHAVQTYFLHAREYYWNDSAAYYLNSLDRLLQLDYIPTQQDVLRSRVKTNGIVESIFTLKNHQFRIIDVSGQGGERRKWAHFFDDVTAVIFVSALTDYDIILLGDDSKTRMLESLEMFKSICKNRRFRQAGIILFLNKKDLLTEKLRFSSINISFPDYHGPSTYYSSVQYIQGQYQKIYLREKINDHERDLYTHLTCAVDTETMQFVFTAISDMIIDMNLRHGRIF